MPAPFVVVQPWGLNKGRDATIISEHETADEAFAQIDRWAAELVRQGFRSDLIELVVVDSAGRLVPRPDSH
jgi:hypothetical protein